MKKSKIIVGLSLLLILSGFVGVKSILQSGEFYINVNDDCRFWLNIVRGKSAIRTIVSGACESLGSETYLKAFNDLVLKEKINESHSSTEVFYINIRSGVSEDPNFSKEITALINSHFNGEYVVKSSDPELLEIVKKN